MVMLTDESVKDILAKLNRLQELFNELDEGTKKAYAEGRISAIVDCRSRGCMYCGELLKVKKDK